MAGETLKGYAVQEKGRKAQSSRMVWATRSHDVTSKSSDKLGRLARLLEYARREFAKLG